MSGKTNLKTSVLVSALSLAMLGIVQAHTITVGPGVGYDFDTIQAGIDAATTGDTVIVAEGRYFGNIHFSGKNIVLTSEDPNNSDVVAATVISGFGRVVTFSNGEAPSCVFSGFTIADGDSGIYCKDSSPSFFKCTIKGNIRGGMYNNNGSPTLISCRFVRNSGHIGGAMYSNGGRPTLIKCTFSENSAWEGGGLAGGEGCRPKLINCIFAHNSAEAHGGAILAGGKRGSLWTVTNCTFVGNLALHCGGGIYYGAIGKLTINNCIFWNNQGIGRRRESWQVSLHGSQKPTISYSCIDGLDVLDDISNGTGNIGQDPLLVDPNNGDYHLRSQAGRWDLKTQKWVCDDVTSPCVDAGDPNIPVGQEPLPNGGRINMGAYGGTAEASKSYFDQPVCTMVVAGDIKGDGKVNFLDFKFTAFHWPSTLDRTSVSLVEPICRIKQAQKNKSCQSCPRKSSFRRKK